jgi:hypothetical protein
LPASEEIAKKYTIISCYTITIKGKNYFIRWMKYLIWNG